MKKILVAPLDWGLGHAARCIPVIRYLIEKKCEVVIGAEGRPLQLLQKEFPALDFAVMPGYSISYPKNGSMVLKMASQIPKILSGIKREQEQLKKIIKEKKIDAVISDNRFGLWSKEIPCVLITHQLMIKSPFGEKFIHHLNAKYISKYAECWVPDFETKNNLSGDLSHEFPLPENTKFIGILSRFSASNEKRVLDSARNDILIILSGPEPQRTVFEKIIIEQASFIGKKILIVQGITEKNERKKLSENVERVSHMTSDELQKEILASEVVLSRPGYSTVMDLAVLGKKAIFVPTPGQTEQEYLAEYFMKKKIAYSVSQRAFNLKTAIMESETYSGFSSELNMDEYKKAIDVFLSSLC